MVAEIHAGTMRLTHLESDWQRMKTIFPPSPKGIPERSQHEFEPEASSSLTSTAHPATAACARDRTTLGIRRCGSLERLIVWTHMPNVAPLRAGLPFREPGRVARKKSNAHQGFNFAVHSADFTIFHPYIAYIPSRTAKDVGVCPSCPSSWARSMARPALPMYLSKESYLSLPVTQGLT